MDTITHNIVEDWVSLWNGELSLAEHIIAEDFVSHAAPLSGGESQTSAGRQSLTGWISGIHAQIKDLQFTLQLGPFRDNDTIVLRWRATGTYTGAAETGADERAIEFFGTDILRLGPDGRIHEYWANADSLWFAQQIGLGLPSIAEDRG